MAGRKFVIGNKTKLSIKKLDAAFLAAYDPANPVSPTGLTPLVGGTSANEQIGAEEVTSTTFGDIGGYADGLVTSQSWSIDYSFNVLGNDPGFKILEAAGLDAIDTLCWIEKVDPTPDGLASGRSISGIVSVMSFSTETPSDGILTGSVNLVGRGSPVIKPAA